MEIFPVPRNAVVLRWSLLAALCCAATFARGELAAKQVAIIAAAGNAESEQLAEYYANARAIPVTSIIRLELPAGDECPREAWEQTVRPAIRAWLAENDPEHELRCLVTVWGVPLKIGPQKPTPGQIAYQEFLAGERGQRLDLLGDAVREFESLAPAGEISTSVVGGGAAAATPQAGGATGDAEATAGPADEVKQLERALELALKAAQGRVAELPAGPARQSAQQRMQQLVASAGGANVIVRNIQQQLGGQLAPNATLVGELQRLRGAGSAWVESREILERQPPSITRDAALLGIIERLGGQLAAIPWLDAQLEIVAKNESAASFDSELALVLWPEDYERLRWQPNYLNRLYDHSDLRRAFPTLMTARLDGPTPAVARGLVDAAIEVERDGLQGKAYFDARGLGDVPGETASLDRAILAAGAEIEALTTVEAVVNQEPALFATAGGGAGQVACPDAALYCGWYSLGKYVDAFAWNRGAVAYHVASDEASGLHDAASQRWCKRLLERGVAATIGAVAEPYFAAYPRPNEFFGLLLPGDRTLAECYWQSLPSVSWTMMLLGDPLYRPYKNVRVQREGAAFREAGR